MPGVFAHARLPAYTEGQGEGSAGREELESEELERYHDDDLPLWDGDE